MNAKGNYREIEAFLESGAGDDLRWKSAMLGTLNKKDLGDVTAGILSSHLECALEYKDCFEAGLFVRYVLCPRVYFEMLTPYRPGIKEILGETLLEGFRKEPASVGRYVAENIERCDNLDYNVLYAVPDRLLKMKKGSRMSQKILEVSICRTAGIPARLNPEDMAVEYCHGGVWRVMEGKPVERARNACLKLRASGKDREFKYMADYSVAMLSEGCFRTLDIKSHGWKNGVVKYMLAPGNYRILTAFRRPDGTVLANAYHAMLEDNATTEIGIDLRRPEPSAVMKDPVEMADFPLATRTNGKTTLKSELDEGGNIVAWIEAGKEPTEHLLNEILELSGEYNAASRTVVFIVSSPAQFGHDTLKRVLKAVPSAKIFVDDDGTHIAGTFDALDTCDRRLPLAVVTDRGLHISYASAGYQIGSAGLLLENADKAPLTYRI